MYPILYQGTSFSLGSYATFMMLAILAGLGTLLWRSRRLSVNTDGRVVALLLCGLLCGWLASRGLPVLLHAAGSAAGWRRLLPTEAAGQSGTAFLIGCLPAALVLAVSKVGCLLSGCCYGQLCEGAWGVRYPFGSHAYVGQYERG